MAKNYLLLSDDVISWAKPCWAVEPPRSAKFQTIIRLRLSMFFSSEFQRLRFRSGPPSWAARSGPSCPSLRPSSASSKEFRPFKNWPHLNAFVPTGVEFSNQSKRNWQQWRTKVINLNPPFKLKRASVRFEKGAQHEFVDSQLAFQSLQLNEINFLCALVTPFPARFFPSLQTELYWNFALKSHLIP